MVHQLSFRILIPELPLRLQILVADVPNSLLSHLSLLVALHRQPLQPVLLQMEVEV